jgi:DNA ligase (NAD+)
MDNLSPDEIYYLQCKDAYYLGTPLISDAAFDILEEKLKAKNSKVVRIVGTSKAGKVAHTFKMLSLGKINVYDETFTHDKDPINEFVKWTLKSPIKYYEALPKLDGNSIELNYIYGQLVSCITRGNGFFGFDKIEIVKNLVPNTIPNKHKKHVEIKGEIVFDIKVFDKKYSREALGPDGSPNARNFVAGLLAKEQYDPTVIKDMHVIVFGMRTFEDPNDAIYVKDSINVLHDYGFNKKFPLFYHRFTDPREFTKVYEKFLKYRTEDTPYKLDGFVVNFIESERDRLGENDHDPEWSIAVKFKPKDAITKLVSHDWKTGTSYEIVPTAVLEPIDLDGSMVSRATLHNWGHVKRMKLGIGAEVLVAKAGDIIPQIYKVVTPSVNLPVPPATCPSCKAPTKIEDIHIWCTNKDCSAVVLKKIEAGIRILGVEKIGNATIPRMYNAGIKSVSDYFDKTKFNMQSLISSGYFVRGRELEIYLNAIDLIKTVPLAAVIESFKFPEAGTSVSKEVAKYYSGIPYDFKGLTKSAITLLTNKNSEEYRQINEFIKLLSTNGVKVTKEVKLVVNTKKTIKFEMTGSPSDTTQFKIKEDFANYIAGYDYEHHKLDAGCNMLITDDLTSNSGKMKSARKLGKLIKTYQQVLNDIDNSK